MPRTLSAPEEVHDLTKRKPPTPERARAAWEQLKALHADMQYDDVIEPLSFTEFADRLVIAAEKSDERKGTPKLNQDMVLAAAKDRLYGVFDGVGGSAYGAKGSRSMSEQLYHYFVNGVHYANEMTDDQKGSELQRDGIDVEGILPKGVTSDICSQLVTGVYRLAMAIMDAQTQIKEGATTVTTAHIIEDPSSGKRYAVLGQIGDSGALVRRADGRVEQVTHEDSALDAIDPELADQMRREPTRPFQVELTDALAKSLSVPADELAQFRNSGRTHIPVTYRKLLSTLTKVVGNYSGKQLRCTPKMSIVELQPGDDLILMTDGTLDFFADERGRLRTGFIETLTEGLTLRETMQVLQKYASHQQALNKDSDDQALVGIGF